MADILVYALHYEGAFNKNSLGAVSEGARLAAEAGGTIIEDEDTDDTVEKIVAWLDERKLI